MILKGSVCAEKCFLEKSCCVFAVLWKNLPFRNSKRGLLDTNAILWIHYSIFKDTERKKMIFKGSVCAEKCFLEKSCCVFRSIVKRSAFPELEVWTFGYKCYLYIYRFRTPFPRILDVKKWFQKVLSARRNASWKNLAVFSQSCEKICLSGTRSMNFFGTNAI